MRSTTFAATVLASLLTSTSAIRTRDLQLAVYWGQGPNEATLGSLCSDPSIDIIPIGFVNQFPGDPGTNGYPEINFASNCGGPFYTAPNGEQTLLYQSCAQIGEDITTCQQAGKKILLSIGGDSPQYSLTSNNATAFADQLWQIFGPNTGSGPRPFGNAVVDGFDLDIESTNGQNWDVFATRMKQNFAGTTGPIKRIPVRSRPRYYLTAAPQCVLRDSHVDSAIRTGLLDYVFIQFYNTDSCAAKQYVRNDGGQDTYEAWASYVATIPASTLVFIGLPASPGAVPNHPDHYLSPEEASTFIKHYGCTGTNFGGVMLWNSYYATNNDNYQTKIRSILDNICGTTTTTTTATTTTTTIRTSTTTTAVTTTTTTTTSRATTTTTVTTTTAAATSPTTTTAATPTTSVYTTPSTTAGTTTTYSPTAGAVTGTTTSTITTTTTTTGRRYFNGTTTTTTTTYYNSPVSTNTATSITWEEWPATTTTTKKYVDPFKTSTTVAWEAWTTTTKKIVDPAKTTTNVAWEDWSTTTKKVVDPAKPTSTVAWEDWSTTTKKVVDPAKPTTTAWEDWTTSTKKVVDAAQSSTTSAAWADWTTSAIAVAPVQSTGAAWGPGNTATKTFGVDAAATSSSWTKPYTGAASQQLPGTVVSIAACVVLSVLGIFL